MLVFGIVADLGWGYVGRLVGALKDRADLRRNVERMADRNKRKEELAKQIGILDDQITVLDQKYDEVLKDSGRLEETERLMLEDYEPRLCPFCKAMNSRDAKYCDHCGWQISDKSAVACLECSARNEPGSRYCTRCGKLLPRYCPVCSWLNRDEASTCTRCRAKIPGVHYGNLKAILTVAKSTIEDEHAEERKLILERLEARKTELVRIREERERIRSELDDLVTEIEAWAKETLPPVSLVVPCHNSENVIEDTLKSLLALEYEQKQIIIVDDASTDNTYELAKKYSDKITLVKRATSTGRKTGATNYGLTFATGDAIVVVDDDTTLQPDALTRIVAALGDENIAAVAGNVKVKAERESLLVKLQSTEYLVNMELGRPFQNALFRALFVISGCFGAFRRDVLEMIGQYDIDIITEDLDITWKIYKLKRRVAYQRDAICYTDTPTSLKVIMRQRIRWDKGLFEVLSKHKNAFLNRRFGRVGLLLLPDTVFTEVALLLLRPAWLLYLALFRYPILPAVLLTIYFYLALEFLATFTAGMLSDNKWNALKALYAPFMFAYRQFLGLVRFAALANHLSGRKMRW
jgi:cellulose synthase/poly-beta-1,6-N-acetylglucosamine synthase-like glycosyltransferase